jgi:hypothetical protein
MNVQDAIRTKRAFPPAAARWRTWYTGKNGKNNLKLHHIWRDRGPNEHDIHGSF